jgi:hypothetical protein
VYSMSTVIGAEYVMSLSRQSCGVVDCEILNPSSTSGIPTLTLLYFRKKNSSAELTT